MPLKPSSPSRPFTQDPLEAEGRGESTDAKLEPVLGGHHQRPHRRRPDLGALADQTYELEFAAGRGYRDRVYAFDTQRVGPVAEEDPSTLRCVLTFSETSRLVLRSKGLQVALSLRPADGGKAFSFLLEPPDVSGEKRDVPARRGGGGPTLSVWRVSEAGDSAAGFSPEEKEKLRALGYIQ